MDLSEHYAKVKKVEDFFSNLMRAREWRIKADVEALMIKNRCDKILRDQNGKLKKPLICERCQQTPSSSLHAHHEDYSKPLKIIWLCIICHRNIHKGRTYQDFYPSVQFVDPCNDVGLGSSVFSEAKEIFKVIKPYIKPKVTKGMVRVDELTNGA